MAITCLLCPSPAVAEGLCVEDGARLWAAKVNQLLIEASLLPKPEQNARALALRELNTKDKATAFLARLDAARAERDAKTCGREGCGGQCLKRDE